MVASLCEDEDFVLPWVHTGHIASSWCSTSSKRVSSDSWTRGATSSRACDCKMWVVVVLDWYSVQDEISKKWVESFPASWAKQIGCSCRGRVRCSVIWPMSSSECWSDIRRRLGNRARELPFQHFAVSQSLGIIKELASSCIIWAVGPNPNLLKVTETVVSFVVFPLNGSGSKQTVLSLDSEHVLLSRMNGAAGAGDPLFSINILQWSFLGPVLVLSERICDSKPSFLEEIKRCEKVIIIYEGDLCLPYQRDLKRPYLQLYNYKHISQLLHSSGAIGLSLLKVVQLSASSPKSSSECSVGSGGMTVIVAAAGSVHQRLLVSSRGRFRWSIPLGHLWRVIARPKSHPSKTICIITSLVTVILFTIGPLNLPIWADQRIMPSPIYGTLSII